MALGFGKEQVLDLSDGKTTAPLSSSQTRLAVMKVGWNSGSIEIEESNF